MKGSSRESLWTIRDILNWTRENFKKKGIETPRLDAEILLSKALGKDRIYLYLNIDKPLNNGERSRIREYVKRRLKHEPVAYITGDKEFYSINYRVNRGVLIPRPETESLVDAAKRLLSDISSEKIAILDLCSGSGNLGITLKSLFPDSIVYMVDKYSVSIDNALLNINIKSLPEIIMLKADIKKMPFNNYAKFSLIVSNPPYISSDDMKTLSPQIRFYENSEALYGGIDGCDFIPYILEIACRNLIDGGFIVLEFPFKQFHNIFFNLKKWTTLNFYGKINDYGNNVQGLIIQKRE